MAVLAAEEALAEVLAVAVVAPSSPVASDTVVAAFPSSRASRAYHRALVHHKNHKRGCRERFRANSPSTSHTTYQTSINSPIRLPETMVDKQHRRMSTKVLNDSQSVIHGSIRYFSQ